MREKLVDEATGEVHDYSRKFGGNGSEMFLPASAPAWMADRQTLWNAVEKADKRKDAQLARDFVITLPFGLTHDQHRAAIKEFVEEHFLAKSKLADVGYHAYGEPIPANSPKTPEHLAEWNKYGIPIYLEGQVPKDAADRHVVARVNRTGEIREYYKYQPHAHVMVPMRSVTPDGLARLKDRPPDGTNPMKFWKDDLEGLRRGWADVLNAHLGRAGRSERVTHLSLADQGSELKPQPKKGPIAAKMEREGRADESLAIADVEAAAQINKHQQLSAQIHDLTLRKLRMVADGVTDMEFENHQSVEIEEEEKRRLHQLRDHREHLEQFYKEQDERQRRYSLQKDQIESEQQRREASGDIADANSRWMKAAGENYDARRPEASLATAVGREAAQFRKEQDTLRQQERDAKDPEQKKLLELRRHIEACDYMALQHEKMAGISGAIIGRRDNEISNRDRERAQEWSRIGTGLRDERDLLKEQIKDREAEKGWSNARAAAGDRPRNLPQDRGNPKDRSPTQPMQFPESANDALWRSRLTGWAERDTWFDNYGPKPGEGNFQGPKHLGEQYAAIRSQREWRPVGSGEVLDRALRTKWDNAENRLVVFAPVGGRNKAADIGPLSSDADKPIGIGTPGLSARDIEAVLAYNQEAKKNGLTPTNAGRREAIDEWRNLDADYREDGVKAQQRDATREGARDPRIDKSSDEFEGDEIFETGRSGLVRKTPRGQTKGNRRAPRTSAANRTRPGAGAQLDAGEGSKRSGGRGGASYLAPPATRQRTAGRGKSGLRSDKPQSCLRCHHCCLPFPALHCPHHPHCMPAAPNQTSG